MNDTKTELILTPLPTTQDKPKYAIRHNQEVIIRQGVILTFNIFQQTGINRDGGFPLMLVRHQGSYLLLVLLLLRVPARVNINFAPATLGVTIIFVKINLWRSPVSVPSVGCQPCSGACENASSVDLTSSALRHRRYGDQTT